MIDIFNNIKFFAPKHGITMEEIASNLGVTTNELVDTANSPKIGAV